MSVDFAEKLLALGVPIFSGNARRGDQPGYWAVTPSGWQKTEPGDRTGLDRPRTHYMAGVGGHVLDVIDVDPRNGGDESFERLVADGLMPRHYAVVSTPRGGHHYYVKAFGAPKDGLEAEGYPGIDVQSAGGLFILPGSTRPGVGDYTLVEDCLNEFDPDDNSGAALAALMLERRASKLSTGEDVPVIGTPIPHGQHQRELFRYACSLRARGLTADEMEMLVTLRAQDCVPAWGGPDSPWKAVAHAANYERGTHHEAFGLVDVELPFLDQLAARCMDLSKPYEPLPRRDWWTTVSGIPLLHESSIVTIYGDPGSLKSMLAQYIALKASRAGAKVLYLDFENARSTQGRIARMAAGEVPATLWLLPVEGKLTAEFVAGMVTERFDLVIFDSATYLTAVSGGNGDDGGDWTRACLDMLNPIRRSGATVVVIDHLPKAADGKASSPAGSTQKRGQADQLFLLKAKPGAYGVVTVARSKDREGAVTQDLKVAELVPFMEMSVVTDEFGIFATEMVRFRDLDEDERRDSTERINEQKVLEAVEQLQAMYKNGDFGTEGYTRANIVAVSGVPAKTVERIVAKLERSGRLKLNEVSTARGKTAKRFYS